jgi:hypothetical protein
LIFLARERRLRESGRSGAEAKTGRTERTMIKQTKGGLKVTTTVKGGLGPRGR